MCGIKYWINYKFEVNIPENKSNMKKLFLFFALPIVATLSFVSCGNDDDENNAPEEENLSDGGNKPNNNVFHEYVDLGLPSGTLWATCNVGATKPEEFGDYFAWGETKPKKVYDINSYKWFDHSKELSSLNDCIFNYESKTLLPEDDAATANWGKEWRMPSSEEQRELIENCHVVWTYNYKNSNVPGVVFFKAKSPYDKCDSSSDHYVPFDSDSTGYIIPYDEFYTSYSTGSDDHIFLPAANVLEEYQFYDDYYADFDKNNLTGYYWSSSKAENYFRISSFVLDFAHGFSSDSLSYVDWHLKVEPFCGMSVRAVRAK